MLTTKNYFHQLDVTSQPNSMTQVDDFDSQPTLKSVEMERQDLPIPALLEPVSQSEEKVHYHITAQEGETEYFPGIKSPSKGYNGNVLGPVMRLRKGQEVTITTENQLEQPATYHWHGLMLPAEADGGPMRVVEPHSQTDVHFDVKNEAATCWFHPHTYLLSPEQLYQGLAGLIYIEDENSDQLKKHLPHEHGVDDIPLIVQDRYFVEDGVVDYEQVFSIDGTRGDHLLLNGALMTKFNTHKRFLRLRLLNASNRTNFKFAFNDQSQFFQIASDGGFLNYPLGMKSLILGAAERAEIVIDLKDTEEEPLYLMVNDFKALEISKTGSLEENVDFSYIYSLREDLLNTIYPEEVADLPFHHILFQGTDERVAVNGRKFQQGRADETYKKDQYYVWRIINQKDDIENMPHPFHAHDTQFRILARNGKLPYKNEMGYKDTLVVNKGEAVDILVKFPDTGLFMHHCHNLEHQEHGMMTHFEVEE
ncbi:multicopper oxidase family protein [Pisciglobus halotolerans]|uniref:Multicopper oxidase with three cupredoxin domains (Includes cell division protein FtsP and spore coat protein CotA) n=1 Tax=Pisciglobus halotolerans TaxID=745365 RepID=A0A1I3BT49_9LACT|nr:multicopper oxidase domain-containing protein [Pisciglobus halotolerans]SFH65350.1 Multicopper oxidase with three cupredoxin domains (includes cell division protein FtsP and spore coat protein CotA) [Pisciglobus halotolerans]